MSARRGTGRSTFGSTRALPSGRVQARYRCPDCHAMHPGHTTFDTRGDADTWLATVRASIVERRHVCPVERKVREEAARRSRQTFCDYAEVWLTTHRKPNGRELSPRTTLLYRKQLDELQPAFGDVPLDQLAPTMIRTWWSELGVHHPGRFTGNSHLYALLRTILGSAVEAELIPANPCTIRGAGQTTRRRTVEPATVPELDAIAAAMPDRYRMAVLLAGWCALRMGEVVELRRRDVTDDAGKVRIQRALAYRDGISWVAAPKAESRRTVAVPPHLRAALLNHLGEHGQPGPDGLLFPSSTEARAGSCGCGYAACAGGHLLSAQLYKHYIPARAAAGRTDLRFHDLRHTGLTFAAHAGASLSDLMARAGHRSVDAAQVYMHAARGRDDEIADRMSQLLGAPAQKATKKSARRPRRSGQGSNRPTLPP